MLQLSIEHHNPNLIIHNKIDASKLEASDQTLYAKAITDFQAHQTSKNLDQNREASINKGGENNDIADEPVFSLSDEQYDAVKKDVLEAGKASKSVIYDLLARNGVNASNMKEGIVDARKRLSKEDFIQVEEQRHGYTLKVKPTVTPENEKSSSTEDTSGSSDSSDQPDVKEAASEENKANDKTANKKENRHNTRSNKRSSGYKKPFNDTAQSNKSDAGSEKMKDITPESENTSEKQEQKASKPKDVPIEDAVIIEEFSAEEVSERLKTGESKPFKEASKPDEVILDAEVVEWTSAKQVQREMAFSNKDHLSSEQNNAAKVTRTDFERATRTSSNAIQTVLALPAPSKVEATGPSNPSA